MVLKVHDTPQEAAKPAAPTKETVTDSKGRVITLRQLDPLQQSRLVRAVGSEAAENSAYMNAFALPAAMVEFIDTDPYALPQSIRQVDSVLQALGNEGMAAINQHLYAKVEKIRTMIEEQGDSENLAAKN